MRSMAAKVAVVVVAGVLTAQVASALAIRRIPGYYDGSGGEFSVFGTGYEQNYSSLAQYDHATLGTGFQSFCLEMDEYYTQSPDDYSIEYYAIEGGKGGAVEIEPGVMGDPLSIGSAWLYSQFARGLLDGYDYIAGAGREASAGALQEAFWYLEDELNYDASGNVFVQQAFAELEGSLGIVTLADLKNDAEPRLFGVAVMNFTKDGEHRQSMPVLVPDGGLSVLMLGAGVLACLALRRRIT